jgi:hypothetical protein
MPAKPISSRVHAAVGAYRNAVAEARNHADAFATAGRNVAEAAKALQPFVTSPVPAVDWSGAPPVAKWTDDLASVINEAKAGLAL